MNSAVPVVPLIVPPAETVTASLKTVVVVLHVILPLFVVSPNVTAPLPPVIVPSLVNEPPNVTAPSEAVIVPELSVVPLKVIVPEEPLISPSFVTFPANVIAPLLPVIVPLLVTVDLNSAVPVLPVIVPPAKTVTAPLKTVDVVLHVILPLFVVSPNVTAPSPQVIVLLFVTVPLKFAAFTFISAPELTVAVPETVSVPFPVITVVVLYEPVAPALTVKFVVVSECPSVSMVTLLAPSVPVLIVEIVMLPSRTAVTSVFPVKIAVSPVLG